MPFLLFAATYDISKGNIVITASSAGQTVTVGSGSPVRDDDPSVTGTSDTNTLTIDTEPEQTANVTLNGLKIFDLWCDRVIEALERAGKEI